MDCVVPTMFPSLPVDFGGGRSTPAVAPVPGSPAGAGADDISLLQFTGVEATSFTDLMADFDGGIQCALSKLTDQYIDEPSTPGLMSVLGEGWMRDVTSVTSTIPTPTFGSAFSSGCHSATPGADTRRTPGRSPRPSRRGKPAMASQTDSEDESSASSPLPEFTGPLPDSYWSLNECQIASISYKDFYKLMAKSKLTQKQIEEQKKLRRRVKNRYSARSCSSRKKGKMTSTEDENAELRARVSELDTLNASLQSQHMLLQERFIELQKSAAEAQRERIFLRVEIDRVRELAMLANVSDCMSADNGRTPDFAGAA